MAKEQVITFRVRDKAALSVLFRALILQVVWVKRPRELMQEPEHPVRIDMLLLVIALELQLSLQVDIHQVGSVGSSGQHSHGVLKALIRDGHIDDPVLQPCPLGPGQEKDLLEQNCFGNKGALQFCQHQILFFEFCISPMQPQVIHDTGVRHLSQP